MFVHVCGFHTFMYLLSYKTLHIPLLHVAYVCLLMPMLLIENNVKPNNTKFQLKFKIKKWREFNFKVKVAPQHCSLHASKGMSFTLKANLLHIWFVSDFLSFPCSSARSWRRNCSNMLAAKVVAYMFFFNNRCLPGNHCLFDWNFNNSLHTTCHKSPGAIHSCRGYAFIPLRPVVARWLHTSLKAFVTRAYSVDSTLSPWLSRIQNYKDGLWYCDYKSLTYDNDVKKKKIFFLTTLYLYSLHF